MFGKLNPELNPFFAMLLLLVKLPLFDELFIPPEPPFFAALLAEFAPFAKSVFELFEANPLNDDVLFALFLTSLELLKLLPNELFPLLLVLLKPVFVALIFELLLAVPLAWGKPLEPELAEATGPNEALFGLILKEDGELAFPGLEAGENEESAAEKTPSPEKVEVAEMFGPVPDVLVGRPLDALLGFPAGLFLKESKSMALPILGPAGEEEVVVDGFESKKVEFPPMLGAPLVTEGVALPLILGEPDTGLWFGLPKLEVNPEVFVKLEAIITHYCPQNPFSQT